MLRFGYPCFVAAAMQESLRQAWCSCRDDQLPAWAQAKAWALREVWRDSGKSDHGLAAYVAGKVAKGNGQHPSGEAIVKLFHKMDADADWFPGKSSERSTPGPRPVVGLQGCSHGQKRDGHEEEGG